MILALLPPVIHPDRIMRIGLSWCLCALLMAPLQAVAVIALTHLAAENPAEESGSEPEALHDSHPARRSTLPMATPRPAGVVHAHHTSACLPASCPAPRVAAKAPPNAGAGVRARC